jgi:hypothetical protein
MPDPDDEIPVMQRFNRLLKAMAPPVPSKSPEEAPQTSAPEDADCGDTQTPGDTSEGAS